MASLQARHRKDCRLGRPWTAFSEAKGCGCGPMYHLAFRVDGRLVREAVGHNRKEAERALDARRGQLAQGTYRLLEATTFERWADDWLAAFTGKESTRAGYASTLRRAKALFGSKRLRDVTASDVARMLDASTAGDVTKAKDLRQLSACLQAAVSEGLLVDNPAKRLHKSKRPRVRRSLPSYFTDGELAGLWPELQHQAPVYPTLCRFAVTTGMRSGELIGLRWSDVNLLERTVQVRRTYSDLYGETLPKGGSARTVDLTPQAAAVLEAWYSGGTPVPGGIVFERETGGYLDPDYVRRVLYGAMSASGVPRVGEGGRPRTFHSFRHTFARIALEHGAEIVWVKDQLGHSSIGLTVDTYGTWARTAMRAQAARLEAVFPL